MPFAYFFTESEGFVGSKKVINVSNFVTPQSCIMNARIHFPIELLSWGISAQSVFMPVWSDMPMCVFVTGCHGPGVRDHCDAASAKSTGAWHCVGGISAAS